MKNDKRIKKRIVFFNDFHNFRPAFGIDGAAIQERIKFQHRKPNMPIVPRDRCPQRPMILIAYCFLILAAEDRNFDPLFGGVVVE